MRSCHGGAVEYFILNYFLHSNKTYKLEVYPPAALIIVSSSLRSDMSNTLLTSSLANLLFALFKIHCPTKPKPSQVLILPGDCCCCIPVCVLSSGPSCSWHSSFHCWGILTLLWERAASSQDRKPRIVTSITQIFL